MLNLGVKLNKWLEIEPHMESMRRDFSLFFEKTIKRDNNIPIPNPFCGGTMLAEKVDQWIAGYKAEGKSEGVSMILCRMKAAGLSITEIARITGFFEDEIKHLI